MIFFRGNIIEDTHIFFLKISILKEGYSIIEVVLGLTSVGDVDSAPGPGPGLRQRPVGGVAGRGRGHLGRQTVDGEGEGGGAAPPVTQH